MKSKQQKTRLRHQLQQQRQALTAEQQISYSEQICQQVLASPCFKKAQHIAFYTPVKGEANPLFLQAISNDKSFYLPVLSTEKAFHLLFVKIDEKTQYKENIYAIPEPIFSKEDIIATQNLDLVIMPLVAADKKGNRMGMGGGYYDRSFSFKHNNKLKPPELLGFAYDFQIVNHLSAKNWDVPLDFIATNKTFIQPDS